MYDANVMPYGSDDDRNTLIEEFDPADIVPLDDDRLSAIVGRQNGKRSAYDERAAAHGRHATIVPGEPKHGQTMAWVRTGITDRQAAGLDPSPHSDAYDADDYNRPRNGLGTYHESDASW